jgi:type III secretory pathway component EscT
VTHGLAYGALEPQTLAQTLALGLLLCARLLPLAWLVPWIAVRDASAPLGVATVLVLALCLWPTAASAAPLLPVSLWSLLALGLREALVGLVYALALALPLRALQWSGELYGRFSRVPGTETAYGSLQLWLGVAAFFAFGGHRVAIAALAEAIVRRPVGALSSLYDLSGVALGSARLVGDAFASALLLALPVAVALGLAELGLLFSLRVAGASGIALALPPARAALGLVVVWIATLLLLGSLPGMFEQGLRAAQRLWESL